MTLRGSSALPTALVIGVVDGSNAPPGTIGEYISASNPSDSSVGVVNNTPVTVVSIALTAGDWDVWGVMDLAYSTSPATTFTSWAAGISGTDNTLGPQQGGSGMGLDPTSFMWFASVTPTSNNEMALVTPTVRVSIAAPKTVYLIASVQWSGTACRAYGSIQARRVR